MFCIPVSWEHVLVYLAQYSSLSKMHKHIPNRLDHCCAAVPSDLKYFNFSVFYASFGHCQVRRKSAGVRSKQETSRTKTGDISVQNRRHLGPKQETSTTGDISVQNRRHLGPKQETSPPHSVVSTLAVRAASSTPRVQIQP